MNTNAKTELAEAKRRKRHAAIRRCARSIAIRAESLTSFWRLPERMTDDEIAYLASIAASLAAELSNELRDRQRGVNQ